MISIRKCSLVLVDVLLPLLCALVRAMRSSPAFRSGFSDLDRRYERIRSRSEAYGGSGSRSRNRLLKPCSRESEGKWATWHRDLWRTRSKGRMFNDPSRRGQNTLKRPRTLSPTTMARADHDK
jgi:hypothetical protein